MMTWRSISVMFLRGGNVAVAVSFSPGLALLVPTLPEREQRRLLWLIEREDL